MANELMANCLTADHLTQDCTQYQHTLRLAGRGAAIAELHRRHKGNNSASPLQAGKPHVDGTTARHGHVALTRTHNATPHAQARNMGGHTDEPSVMTDADGYTAAQLCDYPGLMCCVVGCTTNVHRLRLYHADTRVDRRRVCSICVGKWPDLRCNFGVLQPAYDCARQPADIAAAAAQVAFRRFLVQARAARQQEHTAALPWLPCTPVVGTHRAHCRTRRLRHALRQASLPSSCSASRPCHMAPIDRAMLQLLKPPLGAPRSGRPPPQLSPPRSSLQWPRPVCVLLCSRHNGYAHAHTSG